MTTPDIAGLCERLRNRNDHTFHGPKMGRLFNPDGPEAADTIERQAAEIERLRSKLRALDTFYPHEAALW